MFQELKTKSELPGRLINKNLIAQTVASNRKIMTELVGGDFLDSYVARKDFIVSFSTDPEALTLDIRKIDKISPDRFDWKNIKDEVSFIEPKEGENNLISITPIYYGGKSPLYYSIVNVSTQRYYEARNETFLILGLVFLLAVIFSLLLILLITRRFITDPVAKLEQGARIIGSGNLDYKIDYKGNDEIGEMATQFELMRDRLKQKMTEVQDSETKYRQIAVDFDVQNKELERAMRQKTDFFACMSHEIRTPMNAILGLIDELQENDYDEDTTLYLQTIKKSSDDLLRTINDILDISKSELDHLDLQCTNFNFWESVNSCIRILRSKALQQGLILAYQIDENIPEYLHGDPTRINQILYNIVGNSLKYTQKGSINIIIRVKEQNENNCNLNFIIEDTGIGIPADEIENIFGSYTRVSNEINPTPGTGLGLSIVKTLVQLMKGKIAVNSKIDQGSSFKFDISLNQATKDGIDELKVNVKKIVPLKKQEASNPIKILVVDDSQDNHILIKAYCKELKDEIVHVNNGLEAVNMAKSKKFDLIFMDIEMPVMDGYTSIKRIRELEEYQIGNTEIVFLSAHSSESDVKNGFDNGANSFLKKPIKKSAFLKVISNVKDINVHSKVKQVSGL